MISINGPREFYLRDGFTVSVPDAVGSEYLKLIAMCPDEASALRVRDALELLANKEAQPVAL